MPVRVDVYPRKAMLAAFADARSNGWATLRGTLDQFLPVAVATGAVVVPTRPGGPPIDTLRPTTKSDAHPRSLSSRYGLGCLPFHSDGAHLAAPPQIVMLEACAASDGAGVGTRLIRAHPSDLPDHIESLMRQGVFRVGRGRQAFFAHARCGSGSVRFDPGCMRAVDPVARVVAGFFASEELSATHVHEWSEPRSVLVIDNTSALHGREAAATGGRRVLRRLMLRWDTR